MIIEDLELTPGLASWLASLAVPPLAVRQEGTAVVVTRADGSELSQPEEARVRGILAANRVAPLGVRKKN